MCYNHVITFPLPIVTVIIPNVMSVISGASRSPFDIRYTASIASAESWRQTVDIKTASTIIAIGSNRVRPVIGFCMFPKHNIVSFRKKQEKNKTWWRKFEVKINTFLQWQTKIFPPKLELFTFINCGKPFPGESVGCRTNTVQGIT